MTTETFHARMMNIPIPDHFNSDEDRAAGLRVMYRLGHMDARHAAAEIASEADAEIRRLVRLLDEERRAVTKMGHRLIEAHDILIERVERDGLELPTVAEAVEAWGVPAKVEE